MTHKGSIEHQTFLKELILTFEACSEAPNFKKDWKSDLTIWINGIECGAWQSPGDYGARRGKLNPIWWDNGISQYGKLVTVLISGKQTQINAKYASDITINDFQLNINDAIKLRIGNKEGSKYIGGFNLFGRSFGDYNQDIELPFVY